MSENHDGWHPLDARGKGFLFLGIFSAIGAAGYGIGCLVDELGNNLNDGWRITVIEPVDELVAKIQNTGNLYEITLISLLSSLGLTFLFLAASIKTSSK